MTSGSISHILPRRLPAAFTAAVVCVLFYALETWPVNPVAYDYARACEICDSIPLSPVEGIWTYPDDHVIVLLTRKAAVSPADLPEYEISVVETFDCNLKPGEVIGSLSATTDRKKFRIKLFTRRKSGLLSSPESCMMTLTDDDEVLAFEKTKKKSGFRLNINPNSLLPGFWKIFRMSFSPSSGNTNTPPPAGMVKIYPSYDGNGSSRRTPRYL